MAALPDAPELSHHFALLDPVNAAPDFALADMDDGQHRLADYHGKVILVNFWATWCPPCRREMPALEALYLKYRKQGLVVLAINQWEDADHVFAYMGQLNVFPTFPVLFDPESRVSADYGVKGLPTSFLINRQGKLVYRAIGGREFDHPEIERLLQTLLE
ncbi:MAG: TlpA family protein disulfide reductase [Gammaproteobacteria bacterium]|nr:MAG: TlpA family protein disulfide reductase [Gammaproteobacteria bacterium]